MSHRIVATFEQGKVVAERFRLDRLLGQGGMGEVWLAHHITLDIPCAVKFIRDDKVSERSTARFRQEARSAAKLRSPNVVQMLDHGVWEDTPYIAMEFLEGEALSDRLQRLERLSTGTTLGIARDVGRALSRASELSIVHRDLKPDNLFIVKDGDREIVKVLDFGVAKVPITDVTHEATRTGALVGTPYYMSPEQAQGDRAIDGRADLWSLAVITFRCLTGQLPFQSTGLGALLKAIMLAPVPVPSEVAPDLPRAFDRWWARATQRNPDERYQTADELVDALERALVGKPEGVTTFPDGTDKRVARALSSSNETLALRESTHAPLSSNALEAAVATEAPAATTRPWLIVLPAVALLALGGVYALGVWGDPAPATQPSVDANSEADLPPSASVPEPATTASAPPGPSASALASSVAKPPLIPKTPKAPLTPRPTPSTPTSKSTTPTPQPPKIDPGY